jgi:adenylylsulfate kinase-like enzyme
VVASFISPYREARDNVRQQTTNFIEVYVNAPLEVCASRDVKGLYAKAFAGQIQGFTGVNDPYEAPEKPEIILHTDKETLQQSVDKLITYLEQNNLIPALEVEAAS